MSLAARIRVLAAGGVVLAVFLGTIVVAALLEATPLQTGLAFCATTIPASLWAARVSRRATGGR